MHETHPPKVQPWTAFGVALIVAVSAVLFAVGTWIVRSSQARAAVNRAVALKQDLEHNQLERAALQQTVEDQTKQINDLVTAKQSLEVDRDRMMGEMEAVKRELTGIQQTLTTRTEADTSPATLAFTGLKQVLESDRAVRVECFVEDKENLLTVGSLVEYLKMQLGRSTIGFQMQDGGRNTFQASVVATTVDRTTVERLTSVAVLLELRQDWKVPGVSKRFPVTVWRGHTIGVTSPERVAKFVEDLIDDLLKDLETQAK